MATFDQLVQGFEQRTAACSPDLKHCLDLAWTHRKDQQNGTVLARNADVFALRRTLQAGGTKDQFVALALRHFTEAGIDPRQPHMLGSTPQTRRRVRQVLARLQAGNGDAPN